MFIRFIQWLKGSADNLPGGASSKKLSAFWVLAFLVTPMVWTWLVWAVVNNNWEHLTYVLDALLIFILSCLGINYLEKKAGVHNGGKQNETPI